LWGLPLIAGRPRPLRFLRREAEQVASRRRRVTTQTWLRTFGQGIRWLQTRCRRPGRYSDRGASGGFAGRLGAPNRAAFWVLGLVGIEAFGGGEQSEKRQRHDAIGPRNLHQQHGGKPAQAAGFDEVTFGRADRIAIDAAGADLGSPAPFDGVIKSRSPLGRPTAQRLYQQDQQLTRRPGTTTPPD